MSPNSTQWVTLLPLVERASGKELLLAAAPVLLAIPGILDEAIAVVAGLALVGAIFFLRAHLNANVDSIAQNISSALARGEICKQDADAALRSLERLTTSKVG